MNCQLLDNVRPHDGVMVLVYYIYDNELFNIEFARIFKDTIYFFDRYQYTEVSRAEKIDYVVSSYFMCWAPIVTPF